ncbi:MAG: serine/threonine protein kinase [Planctomycetes bacterium]|nr:serine/threonine protein kinase [Planctomycetota bacterium]
MPALPDEVQTALRKPKQVFGKYVLIKELGRGGMGAVYKAWQLELRRYVAIKFLLGAAGEEELKRFYREAQTAAALAHPNIAAIHEIGLQDGKHFIAMEFIDGHSLEKLKAPKDRRELLRIVEIMRDAAKGVEFAHSKGVIHRDLKPANIMVTKEGKAYVTDFGLARPIKDEAKIPGTGLIVGTPAYMSPEQARGDREKLDRYTDVYSLGATLYELLSGKPPFTGKTALETLQRVVSQEPLPPTRMNPGIPPELEAACLKALEKKKGRRYRSAAEFADDLERYLKGQPLRARPPSGGEKALRFLRKRWPFFAAGAVVLVAAIALWVRAGQKQGELRDLEIRAEELYRQENWPDCQKTLLEFEAKGGKSARASRMLADCKVRLTDTGAAVRRRDAALPHFKQGAAKLEEARGLARVAESGIRAVRDKYREAIGFLEKAVAADATYKEAYYALVEAYNELRDDEGLKHADRLVELDPESGRAYLLRGKLRLWGYLRETGAVYDNTITALSYDAAAVAARVQTDFDNAIRRKVSDFNTDMIAGVRGYLQGDFEKASRAFQSGMSKSADDRDLYLLAAVYAEVAMVHDRRWVSDPVKLAREMYRLQPNDPAALCTYAMQHVVHGLPAGMLDLVERNLRNPPDRHTERLLVRLKVDLLMFALRHAEAAVYAREQAQRLADGFLYLKSLGCDASLTLEGFLRSIEVAKKMDPRCAYGADCIALAKLRSLKRYEEAEREGDRLLREGFYARLKVSRAHRAHLLDNQAMCRNAAGDAAGALKYAEEAVRLFDSGYTRTEYSYALYWNGRDAEARVSALRALEMIDPAINPEQVKYASELLGVLNRKLIRADKQALVTAGQAKLKEARVLARNEKSGTRHVRERYRDAIQALEKAVTEDPDCKEAHYALVEACNELRDGSGLKHSERLVGLDPESGTAHLLRAKSRLWDHLLETGFVFGNTIRTVPYDAEKASSRILSDVTEAVKRGAPAFHLALVQGVLADLSGDLKQAQEAYAAAALKSGDDPDVMFFRAAFAVVARTCDRRLVDDPTGIVTAAYRAQPGDLFTVLLFAIETGRRGNAPQALELLERELGDGPGADALPLLLQVKIDLLARVGRRQEAVRLAKTEAERLKDGFLWAAAIDQDSDGGVEETVPLADKARTVDPRSSFFVDSALLGRLFSAKRFAEAGLVADRLLKEGFYRRLSESRMHQSYLLAWKSQSRYYLGDLPEAEKLGREAAELFPSAFTRFIHACALFSKGAYAEARESAKLAREMLDPEAIPGMRERLEQLLETIRKKTGDDPKK